MLSTGGGQHNLRSRDVLIDCHGRLVLLEICPEDGEKNGGVPVPARRSNGRNRGWLEWFHRERIGFPDSTIVSSCHTDIPRPGGALNGTTTVPLIVVAVTVFTVNPSVIFSAVPLVGYENATVVRPGSKFVPFIRNGTVMFRYHVVVGATDRMVGFGMFPMVNAFMVIFTPPSTVDTRIFHEPVLAFAGSRSCRQCAWP